MVFRSAVHSTKGGLVGEKLLIEDPGPQVSQVLPSVLRQETRVEFDTEQHDIYGAGVEVLQRAGPLLGSFSTEDEGLASPLESFSFDPRAFKRAQARRALNEALAHNERFLGAYDRLLEEVIIPHLKARLVESGHSDEPRVFFYQRPPTMRLQPGPSKEIGRRHRDAEYGHQDGEVNIWLPLTDYALTQTALWVESEEGAGDFHPLDAQYGSFVIFHGTSCWHEVPANPSSYMRVSLDFRVGIEHCFDPEWVLSGTKASHNYQRFML